MTGISTSIELYDRVSAPIYKMLSALDNLTGAFESIETSMDGSFDTKQIEAARRATEQAALDVVRLGDGIEQNERHQQDYNRAVHGGTSAMNGLLGKVTALVGTYATLQSVKKVIDISDTLIQNTARIDLMNDGLQTTPELMKLIYQSAQDARSGFSDMTAVVARFGNNARDAFGSSEEVVAFANLIQKQMVIAGASTAEASNAMLQLSQALGSGVLRGDELRSIFEQAPNLIQSIADYLNVPIGKIRSLAEEGELTADIVRNAIFAASDDINEKFSKMPKTWSQVWTMMKNTALMQFQPVLQKINELANNEDVQNFINGMLGGLATISTALLEVMEFAGMVGSFFVDNWSVLEPIIMGIVAALGLYYAGMLITNGAIAVTTALETAKAAAQKMASGATFIATAEQYGYNAALYACPLVWIIAIIIAAIALIYALVAAINKLTGSTVSATGIIVGVTMAATALAWNLTLSTLDLILGAISTLVNGFIAFGNFIANVFRDPVGSIIHLFGDMADNVLQIIETIARAIDQLFGSNLAGAVSGWRSGLDGKIEQLASKYGNGAYEQVIDKIDLSSESLGLKRWGYVDAFKGGYSWGADAEETLSGLMNGDFGSSDFGSYEGYDAGQIPSNISDIADDTGSMADSLDITSEDLKYLRDIAEKEAVNRFTTAEIKVEMTNNNNVSSDTDLDGIVEYLTIGVTEALEKAAEGVHV